MEDQSTKIFRNLLILGGVFSFILICGSAIQGDLYSGGGGGYVGGQTTVGRVTAGRWNGVGGQTRGGRVTAGRWGGW